MGNANVSDDEKFEQRVELGVLLGILGIFVIGGLLIATFADDGASPSNPADPRISGTWVYATMGGEDGLTRCGDFNNPHLYDRNGQIAQLVEFAPDGLYRSFFGYTTPSGEEHYQTTTAEWESSGGNIHLTSMEVDGSFGGSQEDQAFAVQMPEPNVIVLDPDREAARLVRCRGEVATTFGDDQQSEPAAQNEPTQTGTDSFASMCINQNTINQIDPVFRQALGKAALAEILSQSGLTEAQLLYAGAAFGNQLKNSTLRFRDIRLAGVTDERPSQLTIRCKMDLRVVTPIDETDGAFSSYTQINGAQFSIRIRNPGGAEESVYLLGELIPDGGVPDIETGTE
jgi:hypothetical protein